MLGTKLRVFTYTDILASAPPHFVNPFRRRTRGSKPRVSAQQAFSEKVDNRAAHFTCGEMQPQRVNTLIQSWSGVLVPRWPDHHCAAPHHSV